MITETTPELIAEYGPVSGIVTCNVCDMCMVADGTPERFSREIVAHAMTHHEELVSAKGVMAFAKFLADTDENRQE